MPLMMEAEQVSLNWVGHHGSLVSVLQYLMEKERFVDVTLAAEGRCIKLHGLVLCASSPYFEVNIAMRFQLAYL